MDLFDDYQDEVERLSPEQIEAILSGEETSSSYPLTALIEDVRLGLLEGPPPETAARHVAAMVSAARDEQLGRATIPAVRRRSMRLVTRRRVAGIALAATLVLGAGIAAAITLPERVGERAKEVVPTVVPPETPAARELPEEASHGQAVRTIATDPSLEGCEKGRAVAAAASAKAADVRNNPPKEIDPCARSDVQGAAKSRAAGDAPGRSGEAPGRSGSKPEAGPPDAPPGLGASGRRGGGGSEIGGGGGSGGPSGGGGSGGSDVGGGGGSGGPGGGGGSGGSDVASGGGAGGSGGGGGSGGSSVVPPGVPEGLPTP